MGIFDIFKKKTPIRERNNKPAPTFRGDAPFYSNFGTDIYASDIVVQSIRCKANEFKKLNPRHIRETNGTKSVITDSSIAKCLRRPNEYMTTADFFEKIAIMLELNKNVFIYPMYFLNKAKEKVYTGLYPLNPSTVEYVVDAGGRYFIHFGFTTGYETTLPVQDVIHWRKDYYSDYFGGNNSVDDKRGLLRAIRNYEKLTEGIAKAVQCSCQINGIYKMNTYNSTEAQDKAVREFEEKLQKNESGLLPLDLSGEYIPITRDTKLVDADTLKFMYENILRANGTSLAILNGDYTKAQKEAYYEHALEADIISLGQAFSKCIFSDREASFGNEIVLYPSAIQFMSMDEKLRFLEIAAPSGMILKDEGREIIGLPPLPNGEGQTIAQGYNTLIDLKESEEE